MTNISDERLKFLDEQNEGTVQPDLVRRELIAEVRRLREENDRITDINRKSVKNHNDTVIYAARQAEKVRAAEWTFEDLEKAHKENIDLTRGAVLAEEQCLKLQRERSQLQSQLTALTLDRDNLRAALVQLKFEDCPCRTEFDEPCGTCEAAIEWNVPIVNAALSTPPTASEGVLSDE